MNNWITKEGNGNLLGLLVNTLYYHILKVPTSVRVYVYYTMACSAVPDGSAVPSTEETPLGQRAQRRTWEKFVNSYVSYSIANQLRKYIVPQHEEQDPELDVEAQFGRDAVRNARSAIAKRKRLQCTSGWLWCECIYIH